MPALRRCLLAVIAAVLVVTAASAQDMPVFGKGIATTFAERLLQDVEKALTDVESSRVLGDG